MPAEGSHVAPTWPASHPLTGMGRKSGKEDAQYMEVEQEAYGEEDGVEDEDEDVVAAEEDEDEDAEEEEMESEEDDMGSGDDWDDYYTHAEDEEGPKRSLSGYRTLGSGVYMSSNCVWSSSEAAVSAPEPFSGTGVSLDTDQGTLTDEERRRRMMLARERAQQDLSEKAAAKVSPHLRASLLRPPPPLSRSWSWWLIGCFCLALFLSLLVSAT